MKKPSIAPFAVAIAIILTIATVCVPAQRRVNPNRPAQGQRGVDGSLQFDPQFNRRRNRLPLGDAQLGRQPNPNQARRRELQRRLMQAIGLTPEQHQRMQGIRRSHEDEAITAGRRLRQARQALDRAIMSEPYNEAAVRQATEELAAAQVDKIRLESRIRAQVRGVLNSDQVMRFHQLERQMRREMREQKDQEKEMGARGFSALEPHSPLEPEGIDLVGLLFSLP
ncbi:MAG TPA: periplasmic heavy metal sensor [Blastocatellia bacterium]|jgi:Spy/CpxP family protein refolding chaperone|nr:periplasmic heavy metal sensor [Blastocatellia bacterium]